MAYPPTPVIKQEPVDPILVTRATAAQSLGICTRTLDTLIAQKSIHPVRRIGRKVLIPYSVLQSFARRDHAIEKPDRPACEAELGAEAANGQ